MNSNPDKGNPNDEKGKAKENADNLNDDENTENERKSERHDDKDGTVLGDINDDATKKQE